MRNITLIILTSCILMTAVSCGISDNAEGSKDTTGNNGKSQNVGKATKEGNNPDMQEVLKADIIIGDKTFTAELHNNEDTQSFIKSLPLSMDMSDVNGNEKAYDLKFELPSTNIIKPEKIEKGDIMCWSSNTLVIFYESFSNAYGGYLRLGKIEDSEGLKEAVGKGNVNVTIQAVK